MIGTGTVIGLLATTLSIGTVVPTSISVGQVPRGVGCTPDTQMRIQVDERGHRYMSGFGKAVCDEIGPSRVDVLLTKNSEEVARKSIETVDTNQIAAVAAPCGPGRANWILIAEYSDDLIGMRIQHKLMDDADCG